MRKLSRGEKTGIAAGLVAMLALIFGGVAKAAADDDEDDDELDPDDPGGPIIAAPIPGPIIGAEVIDPLEPIGPIGAEVVPIFVTEDEVFLPSARACANSGESYNVAQWQPNDAGAAHVADAFTALGFPIDTIDILMADKVRAKSRRLWDAQVPKKRSDTLKFAATVFRSRALPGHFNGPDSDIDGIAGECMLGDLTVAINRLNSGNWPPP